MMDESKLRLVLNELFVANPKQYKEPLTRETVDGVTTVYDADGRTVGIFGPGAWAAITEWINERK